MISALCDLQISLSQIRGQLKCKDISNLLQTTSAQACSLDQPIPARSQAHDRCR